MNKEDYNDSHQETTQRIIQKFTEGYIIMYGP